MIKKIVINEFEYKLIYYINDKEVGYLIYKSLYEITDITDLYVEKEYRNKHIASDLMEELLKNICADKIMLEVRKHNYIAIKLYKKYGFNVIAERKKYYKDDDALIMERENKDIYIFAIESSCDETSASIVKNGTVDVATVINSQIDTHTLYGGVVPEIASRMHLENITIVIEETLKKANMKLEDMDAFACTYGPGLLGSLLVGLECAKTLSLIYNKPFIKVNHMMGHIYANKIGNNMNYPLLSLVISGGHTDLILMENENSFKYLGRTLDDAIGECFDKVARIMSIPYPGGPNLEKFASNGDPSYPMPKLLDDDSYNFSFSGIKSYCNNLVHNEKQRGNEIRYYDLACSFQNAVTNSLVCKCEKAIKDLNIKNFIISGGVSSNSFIRNSLTEMCKRNDVNISIPEKKYCTDNATMIGAAAYIHYINNEFASLDTNAESGADL